MKNIISTWVCLDTEDDRSYFPSAKGESTDQKVQNIYWRCACAFFATARMNNPGATLILFCNVEKLPVVDGVYIQSVMDLYEVRVQIVSQIYKTPKGYYDQWRNQFYEFSILQSMATDPFFDTDDRVLLLDSDCIITTDLKGLFGDIGKKRCVTYEIDYLEEHVINGLSRIDMKQVFGELLGKEMTEVPVYHGGEIYASTIEVVRAIMTDFYVLWKQLLELHKKNKPRLNEEAHVLSYLFYKQGITGAVANRYIKRLWTDPASFRNVEPVDKYLAVWHLPAEKRNGFRKFFDYLKDQDFTLNPKEKLNLTNRLQKTFKVPHIPFDKQPYYIGKSFVKKWLTIR